MQTDFLIIGQGLAGSLLAWELLNRECSVIIIDSGLENASQVAAGIINPITGQRFVKSPDVDLLLPVAKNCYTRLSKFFKWNFYLEKQMLRILQNAAEQSAFLKRFEQPEYSNYLGGTNTSIDSQNNLIAPLGIITQKQTGNLQTKLLLKYLRDYFVERGCYRQLDFNYLDLQLQPKLHWQSIYPKKVIFCEGFQVCNNLWFSWLPLQPVKGEILTLQTDATLPKTILNYGDWLLPIDNQQFRLGATFDREIINTRPTEQGKKTLLNNLNKITQRFADASVVLHQANVRPCSPDRQPLIGHHPQHPELNVFNGFGAKGSLQIPWFSQHFADALLLDQPLAKACNIQRFASCYSG